jgi:hypothetical protein
MRRVATSYAVRHSWTHSRLVAYQHRYLRIVAVLFAHGANIYYREGHVKVAQLLVI